MALVLPSSVDYKQSLPALPDAAVQIPVAASPVNGSSFSSGQQIQFDLLNRGFLVPDSMYLSYSWSITKGAAADDAAFFRGTPVYSTFNRLDIQIGSQIVDTIQNYGVVMNLLVNTQLDIAQKYGLQSAYGYFWNVGVATTPAVPAPLLSQLDGRGLAAATSATGSFSAPLVSMLSNAEKLLPLFAMPQIRIILTMDSLANTFNTVANGVSAYTISNVELRYKVVDMGGAVENVVLGMGDKLYIKSQSFACASQTLPATSGYNELVFNQRFASVKSLYALNGSSATSGNQIYDSIDLTSNNGDYSFMIGGVMYPQKPISTSTAKTQALMELKSAAGSIFDKSNNMSINTVEFSAIANPATTTTGAEPGKFIVGTSTERLNSDSLLTGVSTQNSPISYRINTGTSTLNASTVSLVVNYDALIEVDTMTRQASVKA